MLNALLRHVGVLPPAVRQFVGYGTVGAFTTTFDALFFAFLVTVAGWREGVLPGVASVTSYGTASAIAYVLNSRLVFRAQHRGDSLGTMGRFALTFGSSALLAGGIVSLGHVILGNSTPALMTAKVCSIVVIIVWNFTLLRYWVFPASRGPTDQRPVDGGEERHDAR